MTAWWIGGLASLIVVGAGAVGLSRVAQQTAPELKITAETCDPAPQFRVAMDPYDAIKPSAQGWDLLAQGYIQMHPCTGGTLTISGYGVEAGGAWPVLNVALDLDTLGTWTFDHQRRVTAKVPHGGKLTLAFFNNYYSAKTRPIQQRALHLQEVQFAPAP